MIIAVTKIGENALTSTDPNDFIFHSAYNTFKLIIDATKAVTLAASTNNQTFSQAHGLSFVPLVTGFAKINSQARVFAPNGGDVELWGPKLGMVADIDFVYIEADATNIYFNFNNRKGSTQAMTIRFYCLEAVL